LRSACANPDTDPPAAEVRRSALRDQGARSTPERLATAMMKIAGLTIS
jgi:hypothetical protein